VKWNRADWLALLVLAVGALLIAQKRGPLFEQSYRVKTIRDVYVLPPPSQTVALSLGYRAAAADLIFGHVLVAAGVHLSERRLFEFAGQYLETINELDPKFRAPYRYADGILTLQSVKVPDTLQRQARAILLRGTREFPYDQELWAAAGQYLAYLAPSWLQDPAEAAAFRQEGARILAHACELVGSNENIPHQCITAAALFSDAGNNAATRSFLSRMLDIVDDPELRALAEGRLRQLDSEDEVLERQQRSARFNRLHERDLPFASRSELQALGPRFDAAACAGRRLPLADEACSTSFRELLPPPESR
jgi:hypothetical protein